MFYHRLEGHFIVRFEYGTCVSQPFEVAYDRIHHVSVLVNAFAWYDVSEHRLRFGAPDNDTFYNGSSLSGLLNLSFTVFILRVSHLYKLLSLTDTRFGDVEAIDAYDRRRALLGAAVLLAAAAAHDAPLAP